jgi:hypothetical protein
MTEPDTIGQSCEYLDKEMTIMGLLTAFAVAVPALVLDRMASAKDPDQMVLYLMWQNEQLMVGAGSLAFFLAALAFYLQRSHLAYFYGQLRFSCTDARCNGLTSRPLLLQVDSWAAWVRYNLAFVLMVLGFADYAIALFAPDLAKNRPILVISSTAIPAALNWYVKSKHRYQDYPWRKFLHLRPPRD